MADADAFGAGLAISADWTLWTGNPELLLDGAPLGDGTTCVAHPDPPPRKRSTHGPRQARSRSPAPPFVALSRRSFGLPVTRADHCQ